MSVFGAIMHKIFAAAGSVLEQGETTTLPSATLTAQPGAAAPPADLVAPAPLTVPAGPVDVEAVLSRMADQKGGGGNWRVSIVDLLKLLDLDSSLTARKQLAEELAVHAGADGSAEENIALHRAVMAKLAQNGGTVPASLQG